MQPEQFRRWEYLRTVGLGKFVFAWGGGIAVSFCLLFVLMFGMFVRIVLRERVPWAVLFSVTGIGSLFYGLAIASYVWMRQEADYHFTIETNASYAASLNPGRYRVVIDAAGIDLLEVANNGVKWRLAYVDITEIIASTDDYFDPPVLCLSFKTWRSVPFYGLTEESPGWHAVLIKLNEVFGIVQADWRSQLESTIPFGHFIVLWERAAPT